MQRINGNINAPTKVLASAFAAKYSSKRECFNFLSVDCKAYLCSHDTLTVYFLRDLISGKKKCKLLSINTFVNTCRYKVHKCILPFLSVV